ncbi:sugar phosphate isomerase/epimerase family protein [Aquirufa rosea]|uniref:Sugar phosphate isomerase/epimerase n=1 Tax=Aquirufa rosea TaxID=2509241 RepID=A0A4Q1C2P0_9BACT|nr:sugar phosphate isomerase/epimerase [Aquirufa rosea]RXK52534.1 sugar phosphate isomerase/epimerase [Aquirufa rosea]
MINRREFLQQSSLLAFMASLPASEAASSFKMGYSAITWGGKDEQAIADISSLGFRGIQLRANSYAKYKDNPQDLKALLDAAKLQLVMFSSGNVEIDPAKVPSSIEQHVNHAKFVKALGGDSIQLTNSLRKKGETPSKEDLVKLAEVMNEIGKRTKEVGVQATYHNHMHQFGETPEEVDILVKSMNPSYLRLLLDVAHYHQGGGKPADAVLKYKNIIHAFHIKDVESPIKGQESNPSSYKFVELGQGNVDMKGIFTNIRKIKFKGWAIVELDGVPDKSKTPLQCGTISRDFLRDSIGYSFI